MEGMQPTQEISDMRASTLVAIVLGTFVIGSLVGAPQRGQAQADTFYVATDGSDAAGRSGGADQPWATIAYALGRVPDGSTILVRPGRYDGRVRLDAAFANGVTVRAEQPYTAQLRHTATVVTSYYGQGITLEGFDIAHSGPEAGALVVQIQDLRSDGATERIVLRNNILHDSHNNDIVKVNNGARNIAIVGNVFYNQAGSDEHIDINSVTDVLVQDNVFFNDFAGSGRANANDTSSYIVIKDSNGADDGIVGAARITVRRNIFLNWEGSPGSNFILVGEDGNAYYEADTVLIENNLLLGTSANPIRAPFGVKGARNVTFRYNTVAGDLPGNAFAMRLNREGANLPNANISLYGNIWADPTGTMNDFSDTPPADTASFVLRNNLYWNGGAALPETSDDLIFPSADPAAILDDPALPALAGVVLPRWDEAQRRFADGSASIREAFVGLARYGAPGASSAARDADAAQDAPVDDLLGNPRNSGAGPDLGAIEIQPSGPPIEQPYRLYVPLTKA
jgi:hypothetical protein